MRLLAIVVWLAVLGGCMDKESETEVAERFWSALSSNDIDALREIVTEPEQAEFFRDADVSEMSDYDVLQPSEKGVMVRFSSSCYHDVEVPTVLRDVDGRVRVDLHQTMTVAMKAHADRKPKQQYCHSFLDQPMKGKIQGKQWVAHHLDRQLMDFGTVKKERRAIVAEPCPANGSCYDLDSSAILIGGLDLTSVGGDFDHSENITLFTPPGDNQVITEGSYRVSSSKEDGIRLEISFRKDENNFVNGFIDLESGTVDAIR